MVTGVNTRSDLKAGCRTASPAAQVVASWGPDQVIFIPDSSRSRFKLHGDGGIG